MKGRICVAFLIFWFPANSRSIAQLIETDDHLGADFLQSKISFGYSAASDLPLHDVTGSFDVSSAFLTATVPVFNDRVTTAEELTPYFVIARGRVSSLYSEISFLPSIHTSYQTTVGLAGRHRHFRAPPVPSDD
jgi:hypothetical protein